MFCKLGNGTIRDLTLDTNTVYTHPSTIQCNASTEINNLKTSVSNGKTLIANAITDKGVATSSSDTFATMANKISSLNIADPYEDAFMNQLYAYGRPTASDNGSGSWGGSSIVSTNLTVNANLQSTGVNGITYSGTVALQGDDDAGRLEYVVSGNVGRIVEVSVTVNFTGISGTSKVRIYPSIITFGIYNNRSSEINISGSFSNLTIDGYTATCVLNVSGATISVNTNILQNTTGTLVLNPGSITFNPRLEAIYRLPETMSVPYSNYVI